MMEGLLQDIGYGFRVLRKNPVFALVAILTLALGIGANTAIFSIFNAVLLSPLPYPQPEQLVALGASKPNFQNGSISFPNFRDWRKDNQTFQSMAIFRANTYSLTGLGDADEIPAELISSDLFPMLGVRPVLGRVFAPGEDEVGAAPVALIGAGLWARKFGSSPDVLGKSVTLDGRDYTIVGVIPASFSLNINMLHPSDVYVPIGQWANNLLLDRGAGLGFHGIGRLKPGVTLQQARADMARVTQNLAAAYPQKDHGIGAHIVPMKDAMVGGIRVALYVSAGRGRRRAADCLRQRRQPDAGACHPSQSRVRHSGCARRRSRAAAAPTPYREHHARGHGRSSRCGRGLLGNESGAQGVTRHVAARRQHWSRRPGVVIHTRASPCSREFCSACSPL